MEQGGGVVAPSCRCSDDEAAAERDDRMLAACVGLAPLHVLLRQDWALLPVAVCKGGGGGMNRCVEHNKYTGEIGGHGQRTHVSLGFPRSVQCVQSVEVHAPNRASRPYSYGLCVHRKGHGIFVCARERGGLP